MSLILKCIKSSRALMMRRGNWIRLSLASAMLTVVTMLPLMVGVYFDTIVFGYSTEPMFIEYVIVYTLTILLNIFLVAPAFAAYVSYTYGVYSGVRYGADYRVKRAGGYFRNLFCGLLLTVRTAVCAVVLQGAYALTQLLESVLKIKFLGLPMLILAAPLMTLAVIFCLFFCWITGIVFMAPYYFARGEGIFASFKKGIKAFFAHPFLKDGYSLIFIGLIALSVLTLGVLLILFVMPLMMFTYFTLAEYIDSGELLED